MADVNFTYDKMNRVVTMTDALGTTTSTYDLMSRPTSIGGLWANDTVTYDYDKLGREKEISLNGRTVTFGFDNLSRLNEVNRATDTFTYTYKANGSQLDEVDLPNGAKSTFSYDGLGRLTQLQDLKSTAANISNFAYGYDNRDVKTHVQRALGTATPQKVDYSYDDINQLLTEISNELTPVVNNNFSYDAAQNRTASTVDSINSSFSINSLNQISAYTLGGSPVGITHDDNGNTTQLGPKTLTWDDANRLTSVTVTGVAKTEYQYDGLDRRRIAQHYTWNSGTSSWDLQDERRFIYDGMDIIEERDGSNNLIAFYTRTGNIGEVLSRTTPTDTFYYHYDGNGNVVSLTDASENVVATYEYDAYGNLQASSGAEANNNPFRFSTKYFDVTAGFYDYGFRFYDPVTGRWLSRDPIQEEGGINLYGFVGNGPVNAWDEYGLIDDGAPADIDEQIGRIRRAYKTTVRMGATTTSYAYSIMYGELPKQLMFGSVLRGIGLIRASGSVVKNALLAKEYAFAKRIVDFQGGKFVGALKKSQAGIDGYINGVPCSLKQFTGKSLKGVLKHASDAERSARNARYAGVELFIEANNVSKGPLIDFIRKGPLSQIPSQGTIRAITIFTKDGVIRIVGN